MSAINSIFFKILDSRALSSASLCCSRRSWIFVASSKSYACSWASFSIKVCLICFWFSLASNKLCARNLASLYFFILFCFSWYKAFLIYSNSWASSFLLFYYSFCFCWLAYWIIYSLTALASITFCLCFSYCRISSSCFSLIFCKIFKSSSYFYFRFFAAKSWRSFIYCSSCYLTNDCLCRRADLSALCCSMSFCAEYFWISPHSSSDKCEHWSPSSVFCLWFKNGSNFYADVCKVV